MTDFAAMLAADTGQTARTMTLVTPDELADWRATPANRAGRGGRGEVRARPGEVAIVPGDAPGEWSALVGVDLPLDPWALAAAAEKLPAGIYRIVLTPMGRSRRRLARLADGAAPVRPLSQRFEARPSRKFCLFRPPRHRRRSLVGGGDGLGPRSRRYARRRFGPGGAGRRDPGARRRFGAAVKVIAGDALAAGFPTVHAVGRAAASGRG